MLLYWAVFYGLLTWRKIMQKYVEYIEEIVKDSFKRLIKPSVEREIRQEVKERSDEYAINVFGDNLKELLLQSPMKNIRILGFDPGFRNGSKLACIDENRKISRR